MPLPLQEILPSVSRSFYLSLRLLPPETRGAIALAYLLARAADTIADTRVVPAADRVRLLGEVADMIAGTLPPERSAATLAELGGLSDADDISPQERALLARLADCLELLAEQPALEQRLIRTLLAVITGGMQDDLRRFPGERADDLRALETRTELDHYCWQVAGCVGEFWSDLHAARLPTLAGVDRPRWRAQGKRLGRLLQLTNILRDVRRDLLHGRCYLPRQDLARHGLTPEDLLLPGVWPRLRPLFAELIGTAVADAHAGVRHTLVVRPRDVGLRLAEMLPLLLALLTLGIVVENDPLDRYARRKVTRRTVYLTLARAWLAVRDDRKVTRLFTATLRRAGLAGLPPSGARSHRTSSLRA